MLWDLIDKLDAADEAQTKRVWTWVRATYGADLTLQTPNSKLYGVAAVTFAPVGRKTLKTEKGFTFPTEQNVNVMRMRKAFSVTVDPPEAKSFELLRTAGATIPWIQAVLWKRPNRKDSAWVVDVRNAIVVEKEQTHSDSEGRVLSDYYMVCEHIKELVPKSMVPVPAHLQSTEEFQF